MLAQRAILIGDGFFVACACRRFRTIAGTLRIADLNAGPESSYPDRLTVVGETLFSTALTSSTGEELWRIGPLP